MHGHIITIYDNIIIIIIIIIISGISIPHFTAGTVSRRTLAFHHHISTQ
jgi:hypothetical protein